MAIEMPGDWETLTQTNIPLDDLLGSPGIDAEGNAGGAVGAFDTDVTAYAEEGGLNLVAARSVVRPDLAYDMVMAGDLPLHDDNLTRGIGSLAERTVHVLESATGAHVVVQQQLDGYDVAGGRFVRHLDAQGTYSVTGHPVGDLQTRDVGPPPSPDQARAAAQAIAEQFPPEHGQIPEARLMMLPYDGGGEWTWFAKVPLADPYLDLRVFVGDGDYTPRLVYPASVGALYGEATVQPVNPMRTPDPITVCLRDLGAAGDILCGSRVDVTAPGARVQRADRDFRLTPADPAYDEAAAFHFISEALRWFRGIVDPKTFEDPMFNPMTVRVHDKASMNNSFFHPDRGEITLGDIVPDRFASRSGEMVFHEIGHAICQAIARLSGSPSEQVIGLSEGYSDYFACSALGSPIFGDYAKQNPDGARNCANHKPALTPAAAAAARRYTLGEAWANVLWGIRARIGASMADALAIESLQRAQTITTAAQARVALHLADAAMFPTGSPTEGRHSELIDQEFSARFA